MCGIVGYVGSKRAAPILLDGLRRLEYRGYDSAGLAVHDGTSVEIVRAVGKLDNLVRALEDRKLLAGTTGLGHTRWATHGRPNEANAHPHAAGAVALVHNGIIENHLALKHDLEKEGCKFSSDTDTEIVAHLVNRALDQGAKSLFEAVRVALKQVKGAYGLAVVSRTDPSHIVVARHDSPLVIGIGEGEMLCGSDIPALLPYTRDMVFLEDGDLAELSASGMRIEKLTGEVVTRKVRRIEWNPLQAEKAGFKHFMLKEIFEQPRAVEDTLRGRILLDEGEVVDAEMGIDPATARRVQRVYLLACGTSFHASMVGRYWLEQLARIPVQAELASEVRYRDPVFQKDDLVVAVSQSGETLDTLVAVRAAREAGATVLSIANVIESAIPRAAHGALYTHAGPEIGVASTKCFTTQLVAFLLLSVYLGRQRGTLGEAQAREVLQALVELPSEMRRTLEGKDQVADIARKYHQAGHVLFLGRGLSYPLALEGALKLKEISYAHAEGYAAGEMKHGPIALIDEHMPVVVLMPKDRHFDKTLSNVQEVRAREGQVIAITTEGTTEVKGLVQHVIEVPKAPEIVQPLLTILPLQLLAYYSADFKGTDVDQPRNLAKVVTVE